jgi:hypothetical protein
MDAHRQWFERYQIDARHALMHADAAHLQRIHDRAQGFLDAYTSSTSVNAQTIAQARTELQRCFESRQAILQLEAEWRRHYAGVDES